MILLRNARNEFLWRSTNPKIKNDTLCNGLIQGALKNRDVPNNLVSLQC